MLIAIATVVLTLSTAAAADVKGKWEGTVSGQRGDGTRTEDTALLILDQKDSVITGTIGGSDSDQHPIKSGKIDGTKVTIVATNAQNGREYTLELTLEGDQMKGTLTSGSRVGEVVVRKRKE